MRNNQFEKIDVKQVEAKRIVLLFLIFILTAIFSIFTVKSIYAYFTAQASVDGEVTFGSIEVNLLTEDEQLYTEKMFETYHLSNLMPGSTIDFSGLVVENTGTFDEYVLINLDVSIPSATAEQLHYNNWYNVDGMEVNVFNMETNATEATLIAKESSATTNIKWKLPNEAIDDNYKNSTARVTLTAYGVQTLLPEAAAYQDKELYASYFIVSNAPSISEDVHSVNLFDLSTLANAEYITVTDWKTGEFTFDRVSSMPATYVSAKPTTQYYISFEGKAVQAQNMIIVVYYTDGSFTSVAVSGVVGEYVRGGRTLDATKTIDYIKFGGTNGLGVGSSFRKIQLQEGSSATDYVPYREESSYSQIKVTNDPLRRIIGKNLFDKDDMTAGFLPMTGAYPTTNESYPNASYNIIDIKQGQTFTISFSGGDSTQGRIRYIDNDTNEVVGSITTAPTEYYTSTVRQNNGFENGTITALKDFKLGVLYLADITENFQLQIEKGSTATAYEAPIKDSFDIDTQTVTRNIGKYVFTGDENWREAISYDYEYSLPKRLYLPDIINTYALKNVYSSHFTISTETYTCSKMMTFRVGTDYVNFNFDNCASGIDAFKAWLKAEYEAGHPVTLWYQLATSVPESTLTSKNLYEGEQLLRYESGGTSNNVNDKGSVFITDEATQNLSSMELGNVVFDHIKDKSLTISFKMKRYSDDVKTSPSVVVEYKNSSSTVLSSYTKYSNAINADSKWAYYWITIPAINSVSNSANIKSVEMKLANFVSSTKVHFEIHNLQIEAGTVPTDFENYDSTEYARVNGVVLRQMGTGKDVYNSANNTIDRNILKLELTGTNDNGVWNAWAGSATSNSIGIYYRDYSVLGTYNYATFEKTPAKSSHFTYSASGMATANDSLLGCFATVTNSDPPYVAFKVPFTSLADSKDWLYDEYIKGKPVTIWLLLVETTEELL